MSAAVSRALAAELDSRAGWDEDPCLYTIRMSRGQCRLATVPVPRDWWASGHPAEVLDAVAGLAASVRGIPGIRMRPDVYGIAFFFRGWDLPWDDLSPEGHQQAVADLAAHRVQGRPDRIEFRILAGVDRTGTTYEIRQQRGRPEVHQAVFAPGRGRVGAVPGALCRVTAALTGARLPQQQEDPGDEPWE
jgi:hypothetical protein